MMCHKMRSHRCGLEPISLIQLLTLRILYEKPMHGYQIMEEISKITSGLYAPETGVMYTILRRMERRGLLSSKWEKGSGADRRVYTLTKEGIEVLKRRLEILKERKRIIEELLRFYEKKFGEG